jgi:hypothetical protein
MDNFTQSPGNQFSRLNLLQQFMANHKGFIAGGCFKNLFSNERIKDVDIFFENEIDFFNAVRYFDNDSDYVKRYENKKVVAYKNTKNNIVIELIRSVFGSPKEIIDKFDFSITKFAYYKQENGESVSYEAVYHEKFFEHLHLKRLVLNKQIYFPVSTFERSLRYTKYGYGLCRESKENLISAIRETQILDGISNSLYDGVD